MIVKITKGTGLRGLLNYLSKDAGRRIGGNMAGQTPRELAAESSRFQQLRPNLKKKVAHFSLSLHPSEGRPTDEQWTAICDAFLVRMGFAEAPHTIFRHDDTSHAHVHIAALRIDPSGAVIPDANDFRRAEAAARQIESQFGLRVLSAPQKKKKRSFDMKDENEMVEGAAPKTEKVGNRDPRDPLEGRRSRA